jgi:TolB-like protein
VAFVAFGAYARFGGGEGTPATSGASGSGAGAEAVAPPAEASLAVLPFVNMSGSEENEYFSDGITEEILNAVAQIPGLQVAGRTSSFAFKGKSGDLGEIARQLRVGMVLEGSVQRAGERVRITAQLIDAGTGYHVWSERYDRELRDVFAVQDEISVSIADALRLELAPGRPTRAASATGSVRAHELYLLGLAQWNLRTAESLQKAAADFEQAILEDPAWAQPYAGLAMAYILFGLYGAGTNDVYGPRGEAAARRALALDSTLADAHAALGYSMAITNHDWGTAVAEVRRGVELDPNGVTAHSWAGGVFARVGRFAESRAEHERAVALDPLSIGVRVGACASLYAEHDFERAAEECGRVAEASSRPSLVLAKIRLAQGRYEAAGASLRRWAELSGIADAQNALRVTDALAGRAPRAEAEAVLRAWETEPPSRVERSFLAGLYAQLGERDRALALLEAAYPLRESFLPFAATDPLLDPLRSEARFQALLRRMNLPAPRG